ncbi:ADP-ribosylglycohydrolase family protein [Orbaceae bacterium ESL0721]|nr:ADP-ribosylglycohydrolase family protein [Orbaceae bacterium ESL0721]
MSRYNAILGAFYGQALGDAMAMPSELWPRAKVKAHFGWIDHFQDGPKDNSAACYFKAAQFTDDTSMALALADALISNQGEINPEDIGKNILTWAENFDAFNKNVLGPTSKQALNAFRQGTPIAELTNNGVTNGAAMRIMPIGCLLRVDSLPKFIDSVAAASAITHKSDIAIAGATVIAWAISKAIDGESWQAIVNQLPTVAKASQAVGITTFSPSLARRIELALTASQTGADIDDALQNIYDLIGAGTSTIESVPAAIAMVNLANTDANRSAILSANLGGDTDTIGAMATAICGALNGIEKIDQAWRQQLDQTNGVSLKYYAKSLYQLRESGR